MCELSPLPLDGSDCPSFGMASDAEVKPSAEVVVPRLPETGRQAVDQHRDECHVAMMPAEVACRTKVAEADRSVASRTHLSRAAEVPYSGGSGQPYPVPWRPCRGRSLSRSRTATKRRTPEWQMQSGTPSMHPGLHSPSHLTTKRTASRSTTIGDDKSRGRSASGCWSHRFALLISRPDLCRTRAVVEHPPGRS